MGFRPVPPEQSVRHAHAKEGADEPAQPAYALASQRGFGNLSMNCAKVAGSGKREAGDGRPRLCSFLMAPAAAYYHYQ
jgi:hypothetical protein